MKMMRNLFFGLLCLGMLAGSVALAEAAGAAGAEQEATEAVALAAGAKSTPSALFWAIGITMAGGSLAAGYAVAKVGSAAMGAAAERPELLGKAIAFVGLGEGIALFGFLISLFLYLKI